MFSAAGPTPPRPEPTAWPVFRALYAPHAPADTHWQPITQLGMVCIVRRVAPLLFFLHHLRTKWRWQYHLLGLQQRIFPQGWGLHRLFGSSQQLSVLQLGQQIHGMGPEFLQYQRHLRLSLRLNCHQLHPLSFHAKTVCLSTPKLPVLSAKPYNLNGRSLRLSLSTYETTASGTKTCLNCNDKCTNFPGTVCYSCSMGFYPLGLACHKCSDNSMACTSTSACNTCATGTPLREDSACLVELEILVPCRWTVLSCCARPDATLARSAPLPLAVL